MHGTYTKTIVWQIKETPNNVNETCDVGFLTTIPIDFETIFCRTELNWSGSDKFRKILVNKKVCYKVKTGTLSNIILMTHVKKEVDIFFWNLKFFPDYSYLTITWRPNTCLITLIPFINPSNCHIRNTWKLISVHIETWFT